MIENAARRMKHFVTMNIGRKKQIKLWKKAQKGGTMGTTPSSTDTRREGADDGRI